MPFRKHRQPKPPKVPKPAKLPRPKTKGLRTILKGLMTVSQANRIATLSYALGWYDQAVLYLAQHKPGTLDAKAQKSLHWAVAARKNGIGATIENEKETSFLTAVRQYEKACTSLRPPLMDKFYDAFKAKKDALEAKQMRLEGKFGNVVSILQKAIGNRIQLKVADAQKPIQYDTQLKYVNYNREAAKALALKFRQEGLLSVLVDQMDFLARHAALEPGTGEDAGKWFYDPAKDVAVRKEIMNSFIQFAKTAEAPKRLVRSGTVTVKEPKIHVPGAPAVPRGPRTSSPRPLVGNRDVPGSRKRAEMVSLVYSRLKDEQEHAIADVLIGVDNPDRIKQLEGYGVKWGDFTVTIKKDKVVLKHKAATP